MGGLCWFLVGGDLYLCSSGRRSSRYLQKYWDIYTPTSTHTVITEVFYIKEYRRLTWCAKKTRGDIKQLKAELANAQSGNQHEQRASWGTQHRELDDLTYLLKEERMKEERENKKRQREKRKRKREGREKRKGWRRGLKNKREKRKIEKQR